MAHKLQIGRFSVIGHQSNLDDGATNWLTLTAGISDPAQATFSGLYYENQWSGLGRLRHRLDYYF